MPAWFYLERSGLLDDSLRILGVARQDITREQFQQKIIDALNLYVPDEYLDADVYNKLIERINYCCCDLNNHDDYQKLEQSLNGWNKPISYYLAIPPDLFEVVCDGLYNIQILTKNSRIVVEKPIGYSLESSRDIHDKLLKHFNESQIYRIDHYLGKETVQNLIALRFANSLFSSQWNSKSIEYIEITAAESVGIEGRWDYFDGVGQMRDMVQSHILQLLCLIAMEPPSRLNDQSIRNEKVKVLQALQPLTENNISKSFIRAQYSDGQILGAIKPGYLNEEGARSKSKTETFVAIKAEISNWRWSGTPFYIRTGKRMAGKITNIAIHFKSDAHFIFDQDQKSSTGNSLIISLHPTEGISLQVFTKRHGVNEGMRLRSDLMSLDFIKSQKLLKIPSGYQRLLLDILLGNQSLFLCKEEIELAWEWCDNAYKIWQKSLQPLYSYPAGSIGPNESKTLLQQNGHNWHDE
jgi:glucose-6-phosphate 1-dehydrogenase